VQLVPFLNADADANAHADAHADAADQPSDVIDEALSLAAITGVLGHWGEGVGRRLQNLCSKRAPKPMLDICQALACPCQQPASVSHCDTVLRRVSLCQPFVKPLSTFVSVCHPLSSLVNPSQPLSAFVSHCLSASVEPPLERPL
jgi:hypothetical protein